MSQLADERPALEQARSPSPLGGVRRGPHALDDPRRAAHLPLPVEAQTRSAAVKVAVIIPAFRVRAHVLKVLGAIGPEVDGIYVVDDACPEGSGAYVQDNCADPRVRVLFNTSNLGVGGAVLAGYVQAIDDGMDVLVKIDGDGQMDPAILWAFVAPIVAGEADYTKGNRFFDLTNVRRMPGFRLFGNAVLSFFAKVSTGYWHVLDPTNGYTAIHAEVARRLPLGKVNRRYFFETDLLFRLNVMRAAVVDVPMDPVYGDEQSNLSIGKVIPEFLFKHARNTLKRVFYNYFLRDMSFASLQLVIGVLLTLVGLTYGASRWVESAAAHAVTPAGTVAVAALPVLLGIELLLAFFAHDIAAVPARVIHPILRMQSRRRAVRGATEPIQIYTDHS